MDFVNLYSNVDFSEEGKAAFFYRMNRNEAGERQLLGFPANDGNSRVKWIASFALSALILLLLAWNLFSLH